MRCSDVHELLSSHLDQALETVERRALESHVEGCVDCDRRLVALKKTQYMLMAMGRRQAPPDLALRIKVAISNQRELSFRRRMQGWGVRFDNACKAFMLPATAGLVTALVFFGLFVGFFVQPPSVSASNDVPTMLYTPPRLVSASLYGSDMLSLDEPVVIEAEIDSQGRVEDYRIISGDDNREIRKQLDRSLLFAVFEPATAFGQPAHGRVVISFTNVDVRG
jgi:anti-sigma factor RsiW